MLKKNLEILTKIIFFYSLFYIVMKILAILFQNSWPLPNLILTLPFLGFAIFGGFIIKNKKFTWIYVLAGVLIISIIRFYESEWVVAIHKFLD